MNDEGGGTILTASRRARRGLGWAIGAALLASMAIAGSAHATPGIDTWWGNSTTVGQTKGGLFSQQPRGVAINETSGEVYIADALNNRIQRFDAHGVFIEAWGKDVDSVAVGTGYEICTEANNCKAAAASTGLGGEFSSGGGEGANQGVVINQVTQNVYITDGANRRVQEFDKDGNFIRAWGKDVVQTGKAGDNPAASAVQNLTVTATGGKYTLEFQGQKTGDLDFNASAAAIQTALQGLSTIGAGNATVAETGPGVFKITFAGALANNPEPDIVAASAAGEPLTGGNAVVATTTPGSTGFEICNTAADCKAAASTGANTPGALNAPGFPIVAPVGSPNAGNVLVPEASNRRVQEFTATGQFVRAFGWDVVGAGPGNDTTAPADEFEVCNAAAFDVCKAGSEGGGIGQFGSGTPTRMAEDTDGTIYTVEAAANFRVQRFELPGNSVTPEGEFAAAALHGTSSTPVGRDNVSEIAVDDTGDVYVVKAFQIGTGVPPVVIRPASGTSWQQRILRIDPTSHEVMAVMAANSGFVENVSFENVRGLAVGAAGTPIYATTANGTSDAVGRVYRLNEITGLGATVEAASEVGAATATLQAMITPAAIPLSTAYRFEYSSDGITWIKAPVPDVEIGNGSAGGEASTCPTPPAAICQVEQKISNLVPNTTYEVRLVLRTVFNEGAATTLAGPDFTTIPAPPVTTTGAAHWSSPAPSKPSLSLGGTVNPGNARTTYFFEYVEDSVYQADKGSGDGFQHAAQIPAPAAEAGEGLGNVSVHEVIAGLDATKTYHYRLVAANLVGVKAGGERSVLPPSEGDRFFERVSDGDSWGSGVEADVASIADSGERAMFKAQAFGQPPSLPGLETSFISERGDGGWEVEEMVPEPDRAFREIGSQSSVAADLGEMLWLESSIGERERSEAQLGLIDLDGNRTPASPQLVPLERSGKGVYTVQGASASLSRVVFAFQSGVSGSVKLLAEETLPANGRSNLYEIEGAGGPSPELEVVNRATNPSPGVPGAIVGGACGAWLGGGGPQSDLASHAVSGDGSVIYFNAYPGAPVGKCEGTGPKRLYKRINSETTVEVSKSQCVRVAPPCSATDGDDEFQGASADGSVVFFISPRQLTDSDTDTSADLYAYDASPPAGQPNLVQASAGEVAAGHPTPGSGAKVLGTFDNAEDGSRIYFVAEGALSGANALGKAPVGGQKNLYAYERDEAHPTGRIGFVGALVPGVGSGDQREWEKGEAGGKYATALPVGGGIGDGHVLAFITAEKLLGVDTDSSKDLYRYEDGTADPAKALGCISCVGNGTFNVRTALRVTNDVSLPNYQQQARIASADLATMVFTSEEKLLGSDENSGADVYAWHEGTLSLISAGTEGFGVANSFHASGISPDGKDVFFVTRAPLVGSDTNNALDIYDARIGGGFPEQARPVRCESEDGCHGPATPPPVPMSPSSAAFQGPGNQTSKPPCRKDQVRKKGKCVKKPSRHKKHHGKKKTGKRAGHKRGVDR